MSEELDEQQTTAEVVEPIEQSDPGSVEFTPREMAILEDRDPDEVAHEEAPSADTPAEEVSEAPETPEPETPAPTSWIRESDRFVADALGIEDIDSIGSPEEFGRLVKYVSKHAQPKSVEKAETAAEPEYVDQPVVDGRVNVEYWRRHKDDVEGGDVLLAMAERQEALEREIADSKKQQEERLTAQEQEAVERENARQLDAFHNTVDSHRPDFYGKSADEFGNLVTLTPEQNQRREALFTEIYWLTQRTAFEQQQKGLPVAQPSWAHLVKQAESRVFAADLAKLDQEKKLSAAKRQSSTIRPAAGSAGAAPARRVAVTQSDDPTELANDPDIAAAWSRNQLNGAR